MAETQAKNHGGIVAFEGQPDVISTQLRLLPTSPQILILPSVQCYIPHDDLEEAFDVRTYIRKVHNALIARNETARGFLEGACPASKRLVFMNGGTPSAQALCIKAIMKHETGGDRAEAEAVFNQLVKDGLPGLDNHSNVAKDTDSTGYDVEEDIDDEFQDPITRAMRAADALDRETANLQPIDMLDLTMNTRGRSLSLPLYGYSDDNDATPFFLFGAQQEEEPEPEPEQPVPESADAPTFSLVDYNQAPRRQRVDSLERPPLSPDCTADTFKPLSPKRVDPEILSPMSDVFSIRTNENIVLGEASLMDVRTSVPRQLGRIKSMDRVYPLTAKFRDLCVPSPGPETTEAPAKRRPHSFMVLTEKTQPAASRRLSYMERPRTIFFKQRRHTIRVEFDATPFDRVSRKEKNPAVSTYVDRATDTADAEVVEDPFQPVLPCIEDLVVYFKDESPDGLLYPIIKAFEMGNYPVLSHVESVSNENIGFSHPATPSEQSEYTQDLSTEHDRVSKATTMLNTSPDDDDEYDPFAYAPDSWKPPKQEQTIPTVNIVRPPTPAKTPPPPGTPKEEKFHEFDMNSNQTAVAIQNSLRSILNNYFPPEEEGYHQFQFSLLPEFDGLWKPVFRESASRSSQQELTRRVDQILAIGSQQGVKKAYSSGIIKQLEKFGTKSSDERGRSGRVDFRYLLANAMQSFTALPYANQTSDNPFTNPYLLATLILPHLETYLALHPEIRYLLLEYPPEHLPTVLALQKLIGVDLVKVAQIVDSTSKSRLPFTQIGGPALGAKKGSSDSKTPTLSPRSSSSDITVSNANFLLTSTATEADIAKFISSVWSIEADASDSEEPIYHSSKSRRSNQLSPVDTSFSEHARPSGSSHSHLSTTSMGDTESLSLSPSSRRTSIVDQRAKTPKTPKTPKSDTSKQRGRLFSRKNLLRGADSASIHTTFDSHEDSELDLEERRLMPMFLMKPGERKGNTRKALKFLGLA